MSSVSVTNPWIVGMGPEEGVGEGRARHAVKVDAAQPQVEHEKEKVPVIVMAHAVLHDGEGEVR